MDDLKFIQINIKGYKFIQIDYNIRLYYKIDKDFQGFEFKGLECTGFPIDKKNEYFFSPESDIEIIITGTAYFDGVRHLFYGDEKSDNYGYHYYPNLNNLIKILQELKNLENKYCIQD